MTPKKKDAKSSRKRKTPPDGRPPRAQEGRGARARAGAAGDAQQGGDDDAEDVNTRISEIWLKIAYMYDVKCPKIDEEDK